MIGPALFGPAPGLWLAGCGTAFPARRLDNAEVLALVRGDDERRATFTAAAIEADLGLRYRHWAALPNAAPTPGARPTSADLACDAARAALADAGADAGDVGLVVVATSSPHSMTASVAAAVGAAIGVKAMCMDVRAGCAGGVFGLMTAALYMAAGVDSCLLVGVDVFSRMAPAHNALAALSVGDGACALLLRASERSVIEALCARTDGALGGLMTTPGGMPPTHAEIDAGAYRFAGDTQAVADVVPDAYAAVIEAALEHARVSPGAVDLFVPHQTNQAVIAEVVRRAGLAPARVVSTLAEHANIGAAGWMVALTAARADGRLAAAERVLIAAVGGGMSWGAVLLRGPLTTGG